MTKQSFRSRVLEERPDVVESYVGNEVKRKLALALRALRKTNGFTQMDIEKRSGLAQSMISRLEAPTGSLPNWETITRYVVACDGHMLLGFSSSEFDERAFVTSKKCTADGVIAAVAV